MYKKWKSDLATYLTLRESLKARVELALAPDEGAPAATVCGKRQETKCSAEATCLCARR